MADRDILSGDQAIAPHQNIYRHYRKYCDETNMDSLDNHFGVESTKSDNQVQLAFIKPGGIYQAQHIFQNKLARMAGQTL